MNRASSRVRTMTYAGSEPVEAAQFVSLSRDEIVFIKLVSRIDLGSRGCIDRNLVARIAHHIDNFLMLRNLAVQERFLAFYKLNLRPEALQGLQITIRNVANRNVGLCVA